MTKAVALTPGLLLEGKYKIVGLIGEGAWGDVFEGVNVRIQRRIAIKILKAEYASNEAMVGRFEREARASTTIESPHVVQIFDAGVLTDGRPYLVMEFLIGQDLGVVIDKAGGRLPIVNAVDLCAQAARGLAAAHAAGVFHRDMKPSNIVVAQTKTGGEVAKIVDFGISKLLDGTEPSVSHTQTGTVLGSPAYMSPEQARGSKATDHRSDIYSLGVVLYECLTGKTPHFAEGFNELLFKIVLEDVPSARSHRPEIDADLDALLHRVLAKLPEHRVQTATELEGLLVDWLTKNGARVGESRIEDSGPRLLGGARVGPLPDLSFSPVSDTGETVVFGAGAPSPGPQASARAASGELAATVNVGSGHVITPTSASPFVSALVSGTARAEGIAETVPAPSQQSTTGSSALTAPTVRRARRWVYPVVLAVGLLVLLGVGATVALRATPTIASPPRAAASAGPVFEPRASPSPPPVPTMTAGIDAATASPATPSATASARVVGAAAGIATTLATARPAAIPRSHAEAPVPPTASAQQAVTSPPPPSAASAAVPPSVGGRTIRTDL